MKGETIVYNSTKGLLHYQVIDTLYNDRPSRVLFSGNHIAAESGIALDNNKELLFDYNERFMELIRGLKPKRILLVGGGAFTLPKAINEEFPYIVLDVVELDPELYKISKTYFDFQPNNNTNIYIQDGNEYLESTKQLYDLIIVDVFCINKIPKTFQSKHFIKNLKKSLRKDGLVAMNVIASYYGRRSSSLTCLILIFKTFFDYVQLYPAGSAISLWLPQNIIITAQNTSQDVQSLLRYEALKSPKKNWRQMLSV
jgi:spermidine synthase